MKHSEALRKAQQDGVQQVPGDYIHRGGNGEVCACAAGAIAYENGYPERLWGNTTTGHLLDLYPELGEHVNHPYRPGETWNVIGVLVDLSDHRKWTFNQIAAWLEQEGY